MGDTGRAMAVGRLTRDGVLFGYIAIDAQRWSLTKRVGLRSQKWSETRRRYRLDLLNDWDEGFLTAEDDAELAQGKFQYKGESLAYEELTGAAGSAILADRFSDWA